MRDTIVHTMWRPVGRILAELSAISVVPDRGVIGSSPPDVALLTVRIPWGQKTETNILTDESRVRVIR